MSYTYTT